MHKSEKLFPSGDGWLYGDTGHLLIGLIIEEVTSILLRVKFARAFGTR